MAARKSGRTKSAATAWVPQTKDEVVRAIAEIGELQRGRAVIQARMNDELAKAKESFEAEAQPLGERMQLLTRGVQMWCEVNRTALTRGGRTKTAQLPSGEVGWRTSPPKVTIRGAEAVMDALRRLGLGRFIRTKEEISKEAILAEPDAVTMIQGIAITQAEEFVVKPFETSLEEVA
jgi:phage host-nuclease inhibitor protein Gam